VWWFVLLVVVLVLAALAWQPWRTSPPVVSPSPPPPTISTPVPSPTPSQTPAPSPTGGASLTASTRPTPPQVPTGQFDASTAQGLFVTPEQLATTLPAAKGGVSQAAGPLPWGLTDEGTVLPSDCLVARTVVGSAPPDYEAQEWTAPDLTFRQEVTLLGDATAARTAFATLVGAVDACPEYGVLAGNLVTERWTVQPAIEGQGLFPSIVQDVAVQVGDAAENGYRGHLLVGNAIVTWTARTPSAVDVLGSSDDLSAVLQDRALAAVRALG
jgi:hypothetical protein